MSLPSEEVDWVSSGYVYVRAGVVRAVSLGPVAGERMVVAVVAAVVGVDSLDLGFPSATWSGKRYRMGFRKKLHW